VTRLSRSHLAPSQLASLGTDEQARLLHVATCTFCRHLAAHQLADPPDSRDTLDPDAEAKILDRPELQRAFAILGASPHLHRRARKVVAFVAYALRPPGSYAAEVLFNAGRYLEDSRHLPAMPFAPTHAEPLIFLDWDELASPLRRAICREVRAGEGAKDLPAAQLDVDLQELISWRYEILRRVRILFAGCKVPPTL
jgi:hypothetical protein